MLIIKDKGKLLLAVYFFNMMSGIQAGEISSYNTSNPTIEDLCNTMEQVLNNTNLQDCIKKCKDWKEKYPNKFLYSAHHEKFNRELFLYDALNVLLSKENFLSWYILERIKYNGIGDIFFTSLDPVGIWYAVEEYFRQNNILFSVNNLSWFVSDLEKSISSEGSVYYFISSCLCNKQHDFLSLCGTAYVPHVIEKILCLCKDVVSNSNKKYCDREATFSEYMAYYCLRNWKEKSFGCYSGSMISCCNLVSDINKGYEKCPNIQKYSLLLLFAHQNDSESLFAKLPAEIFYEIIGNLKKLDHRSKWIQEQFGQRLLLSEIRKSMHGYVGLSGNLSLK